MVPFHCSPVAQAVAFDGWKLVGKLLRGDGAMISGSMSWRAAITGTAPLRLRTRMSHPCTPAGTLTCANAQRPGSKSCTVRVPPLYAIVGGVIGFVDRV